MLRHNSFVKIWEIEDNDKYATVRMSTSRKAKDNDEYDAKIANKDGYVNDNFSYVRFIGEAYNQLKKYEVEIGSTITGLEFGLDREPYWNKNTEQLEYPKNDKIVVFSFELPSDKASESNPKNIDRAPKVSETTTTIKKEVPKKEYKKVEEITEEDCPF